MFVGLEHIESGTGRRVGSETVERSELTGRKARFRTGDIVYGYLRPYLNKVWVADFDGLCSVDQYVYVVDVQRADAEYIACFMRSPLFLSRAPVDSGPGQLPRIRLDEIARVELDLPPLIEQKRIAAVLREQLDAAARMRAAAERQAEAVQQLKLSAMDCAFGMLPSELPMTPMGELARVVSGYAFRSAWFADHGVRLLRNANVSQGSIDWTETVRLPEELRPEFAEYELNAGDIVLALDRPIVSAGLKVARLDEADVPSLLLQRVATFQLGDGLDPGYLYAFLRTSTFRDAISGHEQSLGVPHVSPRQVASVRLPVPTLAMQRDIARALEGELRLASSAARGLEEQAAEIGRLPAALLRSAFSGAGPED